MLEAPDKVEALAVRVRDLGQRVMHRELPLVRRLVPDKDRAPIAEGRLVEHRDEAEREEVANKRLRARDRVAGLETERPPGPENR